MGNFVGEVDEEANIFSGSYACQDGESTSIGYIEWVITFNRAQYAFRFVNNVDHEATKFVIESHAFVDDKFSGGSDSVLLPGVNSVDALPRLRDLEGDTVMLGQTVTKEDATLIDSLTLRILAVRHIYQQNTPVKINNRCLLVN